MKKIIFAALFALLMTFSVTSVYAEDSKDAQSYITIEQASQKTALDIQSGDALVEVNGLVCDFCARALEKVFGKQDAVQTINVNLDTKIITVVFKPEKTMSNEQITKLIMDSGYNVETINRVE